MTSFWRASPAAAVDAPQAGAASWGRVMLPGEAETLTAATRAVEGVAIEHSTFSALTALATPHGIALPVRKNAVELKSPSPIRAARALWCNRPTAEATGRFLAIVTATVAVFALGVAVGSRSRRPSAVRLA